MNHFVLLWFQHILCGQTHTQFTIISFNEIGSDPVSIFTDHFNYMQLLTIKFIWHWFPNYFLRTFSNLDEAHFLSVIQFIHMVIEVKSELTLEWFVDDCWLCWPKLMLLRGVSIGKRGLCDDCAPKKCTLHKWINFRHISLNQWIGNHKWFSIANLANVSTFGQIDSGLIVQHTNRKQTTHTHIEFMY